MNGKQSTAVSRLSTYDSAEEFSTDTAIAMFMVEAFQTNDAADVAHAPGVMARARGRAQIAKSL